VPAPLAAAATLPPPAPAAAAPAAAPTSAAAPATATAAATVSQQQGQQGPATGAASILHLPVLGDGYATIRLGAAAGATKLPKVGQVGGGSGGRAWFA